MGTAHVGKLLDTLGEGEETEVTGHHLPWPMEMVWVYAETVTLKWLNVSFFLSPYNKPPQNLEN